MGGGMQPARWLVPVKKAAHFFLLCLFRSGYFKKHRAEILKPLVTDARFFEETGLPIGLNAQGEEVRINISIEALIGDKLGCHTLGGYTENFSTARKICRFCYATPESIQTITSESECAPRTVALYEEELTGLRDSNFDGENSCMHLYGGICSSGLCDVAWRSANQRADRPIATFEYPR